jgi:hypothetical protein
MHPALGLLLFVVASLLPGWLLARGALRDEDPLLVGVSGVVAGVFGLPVVHFAVAWLFGVSITAPVVLAVGVAAGALGFWLEQR